MYTAAHVVMLAPPVVKVHVRCGKFPPPPPHHVDPPPDFDDDVIDDDEIHVHVRTVDDD